MPGLDGGGVGKDGGVVPGELEGAGDALARAAGVAESLVTIGQSREVDGGFAVAAELELPGSNSCGVAPAPRRKT